MWDFSPERIQDRFANNSAFMEKHFPGLYVKIKDQSFNRLTLSVNTKEERIDIFDNKRSLYLGDAETYIEEETALFNKQFSEGAPITTILPIASDNYNGPRFFHSHLNKTINDMDHDYIHDRDHLLPSDLPMTMFMGIGTGRHIQNLLSNRKIQIVTVMETNPEMLLLSMYLTDWYLIIPEFTKKKSRYFNFVLIPSENEHDIFKAAWNELIRYTPVFPSLTVFYNHLKDAPRDRVIKKIQAEYKVFITAWGFYDDEANQFNNARHNLDNRIPIIPSKLTIPLSKASTNTMAVIVGAGPSLNERIDWLQKNRDKYILFSSGTALSVLKHHDIIPDIHVEIESDYATVLHLQHTLTEDFQVPLLIGAIQLNPAAFNLVKNRIMYFKDSTPLFDLFGKKCSIQLQGMTPTCTNAAMSLAIQLGFKSVALFGTDFGYKSVEDSHATGSVYFDKDAPDYIQEVPKKRIGQMSVESIDGEIIQTEPIYNSARDRIEKMVEVHRKSTNVYNCSTGAKIEGTKVLRTIGEFETLLTQSAIPSDYAAALLYESMLLPDSEIEIGKNLAFEYLHSTCQRFINALKEMECTQKDLVYTLLSLTTTNEDAYRRSRSSLYFLTRGTLWHYMNVGISVAFSTMSEDKQAQHIETWRVRFIDFLEKLPSHFDWISKRDVPIDKDGWLLKRITEEVDDPFYTEEVK